MAESMGEGWRMMEVQGSPSAPKPKSRVVGEGKSETRNQVNGGVSALSSSSKAKARHILSLSSHCSWRRKAWPGSIEAPSPLQPLVLGVQLPRACWGLSRNQPCPHPDLELPASSAGNPVCAALLWPPVDTHRHPWVLAWSDFVGKGQ